MARNPRPRRPKINPGLISRKTKEITPGLTSPAPATLSHVDADGRARMVDVTEKPITAREAVARGFVQMAPATIRLIRAGRVAKGDPLQTARLAGIMAAKRTSEIIPLCHPVALSHCGVELRARRRGYEIEARARTTGPTGVEMEALTAVAAAGLTIYDMVKAVDRGVVIGDIRLIEKRGGRSGAWTRQTDTRAPAPSPRVTPSAQRRR